jgi:carboxypeptidase Taq
LDKHDPGMTAARIEVLFAELKREPRAARERIVAARRPVKREARAVPGGETERVSPRGDDGAGLDTGAAGSTWSLHPFSSGDGFDSRMTTRFDVDNPLDSLLSAIHETDTGSTSRGLRASGSARRWARRGGHGYP